MSASPAVRPRAIRDERELRNELHSIAGRLLTLASDIRAFGYHARETRHAAVRNGKAASDIVKQADKDIALAGYFESLCRDLDCDRQVLR